MAAKLDPVYARSYQMASKLSFDVKKNIYKLKNINRRDFYDGISESEPKSEKFYLIAEKTDQLPPNYKDAGYKVEAKTPVSGSDVFEVWEVRR